ncbi:hypothetical protein [Nevskia soli]|uniref:hypothetical protein n=1 Tax=Nevskia soli TaxID=418856 RepID=UPI0004A70D82|nr:hypothetical protein [Nevskia soli]
MRRKIASLVTAFLSVAGICAVLASYVFCSSWYAEDELRDLFDNDDAMLVAILAVVAMLCIGASLISALRNGRGLLWRGFLAAILVVAVTQFLLLETRSMCLSLPGFFGSGHWVMRVESSG